LGLGFIWCHAQVVKGMRRTLALHDAGAGLLHAAARSAKAESVEKVLLKREATGGSSRMSGGRFERKEGECRSAWEHMHTQARRHTNTEGFTNSRTHSTSPPAVQRSADIAIHAGNHRGSRQLQRHLLNVLKHSMCPPHTHAHAHTRTHTQTHAHAHTRTHTSEHN
jgi:hypothetical protein